MYIANNIIQNGAKNILEYMPKSIRKYLYNINLSEAYEIHIGVDMPVCIYFMDGRYCINRKGMLTRNLNEAVRISREEMKRCVELITAASVYSFAEEMKNGYITIEGGHRIGICGSAVVKNNEVTYIRDISALNFRIAGECIGAADKVMDRITDGKTVKNTLFISAPGAGKTTILRDCARQLSNKGFRVAMIDERDELAAMHGGKSSFDLGISCDVLTGINKRDGMTMALRTMSPQVIITDELGTIGDIEAVERMTICGVSVIASMHGGSIIQSSELFKYFDMAIRLSSRRGAGTIEEIFEKE